MIKIKLGKYQHYKGKFYNVLGMAYNSETLEKMVIYQGLYNSKKFGDKPIWVRPEKEFLENVTVNDNKIPRFKFIGEK